MQKASQFIRSKVQPLFLYWIGAVTFLFFFVSGCDQLYSEQQDVVVARAGNSYLYRSELRENIIEDFYLTPDYFEQELNTKFGSGFSIQPKFTQSAYFRFHNKSEIYDGLYFVGAGTHPGAGVPGVLSSAKVLDKII